MLNITPQSKRKAVIAHVLADLREFKKKNPDFDPYPIDENIMFFEALRSFGDFAKWVFNTPEINQSSYN